MNEKLLQVVTGQVPEVDAVVSGDLSKILLPMPGIQEEFDELVYATFFAVDAFKVIVLAAFAKLFFV